MFCRTMEIGLLGSRIAYALKEPYILVYMMIRQTLIDNSNQNINKMSWSNINSNSNNLFLVTLINIHSFDWLRNFVHIPMNQIQN